MSKRYIVQNLKGITSILELDVREVSIAECPSLAWSLKEEESLYEVLLPLSLKGERYYNYFLTYSPELAQQRAAIAAKDDAWRTARKTSTIVDLDKLQEKINSIKIIYL